MSAAYKRVLSAIIKDDDNIYNIICYVHVYCFRPLRLPAIFVFAFFTFQQVKLNIERWFPINSDKLYKIEEDDGDTIVFYFPTTKVNTKNQYFCYYVFFSRH